MATNLKQGAIIQGAKHAYTIEKMLGQGSFGITYLARYRARVSGEMGSGYVTAQVCIKEFFMKDFNTRDEQTGSLNDTSGVTIVERYRNAFMREAKNLARMQHPGIVNVFEVIEANNTVYIVMEYIDGGSLDDYIRSKGRLSEEEAVRCIRPICEALDYMHRQRMLHLDMKPKNVMRDTEGHLYLIDFGLSKQYDANGEPESSTSIGLGTPGYAPTEQAVQKIDDEHNFRATIDVYALGATLYKMLTGQTPPLATEVSDAVLDGEDLIQQNLTQIGVSKGLAQTVSKAMWPSSKKRLQSVTELLSCLRASIPMGEDALIEAYDNAIDYALNAPLLDNSQTQSLDDIIASLEDDSENPAKSKSKDSDTKGDEDTINLDAEATAAKEKAEAEARAKAEQERKEREEAGRKAREEAAKKAEAERKSKAEAARKAREEAERQKAKASPTSQSSEPDSKKPWLWGIAVALALVLLVWPKSQTEAPSKEDPKSFPAINANGHDYVDLGLKDSKGRTIYWATCNVGASNPEDYGLYFAWGETRGYSSNTNDNRKFDWSNYKWMKSGYSSWEHITKYTIDDGDAESEDFAYLLVLGRTSSDWYSNGKFVGDNLNTLLPDDDAAHVNWGGDWRMPTYAELNQLRTKCDWIWDSSKKGYRVEGPNGSSIFLPAAGCRNDSYLDEAGSFGNYWSSSLFSNYSEDAYSLGLGSNLVACFYYTRFYGLSVRAVCVSSE